MKFGPRGPVTARDGGLTVTAPRRWQAEFTHLGLTRLPPTPDASRMRGRLFVFSAVAISALVAAVTQAGASSAVQASQSSWAAQANQVCVVWLAKAKQEFGSPVTAAQLYTFAGKARTLESQELAVLEQITGRSDAGTAALTAMKADIAEVGSAITAWNQGKAALFVTILKRYLDDGRPKSAFAIASANQCG